MKIVQKFHYILVVTRVRNPVHGWDLKHIKNNLPMIEPQSSGSRTSLHHISIKGQLKTICLDFLEVFLARTVLNLIWTSWTRYRLNLTVTKSWNFLTLTTLTLTCTNDIKISILPFALPLFAKMSTYNLAWQYSCWRTSLIASSVSSKIPYNVGSNWTTKTWI